MKLRPLQDRIIVKQVAEETRSPGGILLPDTATEKPMRGAVIAVGPGKIQKDGSLRPPDLKAGDHILFGQHAGTAITLDGEKLLVLREEELFAVLGNPMDALIAEVEALTGELSLDPRAPPAPGPGGRAVAPVGNSRPPQPANYSTHGSGGGSDD